MTLAITTSDYCPDDTYFRTGEVEPDLTGDALTIYTGNGRSRSWGRPGVTSTVVLDTEHLVSVHVGFHHKHGGGQFWRHYRDDQQVTWAKLNDDERQSVLDAAKEKAPYWAKSPGKLRAEAKRPYSETHTRYKIVRVEDDRLVSGFDSETEYVIGKALIQKAREGHDGGYYVYESERGVIELFKDGSLFPDRVYQQGGVFAVIECEVSGTCVEYSQLIYTAPIPDSEPFEGDFASRDDYGDWLDLTPEQDRAYMRARTEYDAAYERWERSAVLRVKEAWTRIVPIRIVSTFEHRPSVAEVA